LRVRHFTGWERGAAGALPAFLVFCGEFLEAGTCAADFFGCCIHLKLQSVEVERFRDGLGSRAGRALSAFDGDMLG
jgi:hypothetical protein